ncbi:MAG TPA: tetratricopeptide repeat protein [Rhodocyclaceae bacterium]
MDYRKLVVTALTALAASAVLAAPLDDAKQLVRQGKAQQAMELLDAHLSEMAGDVDYNYILGIAALDAGKPGAAALAFERVLAIEPNHPLARAELARALIALTEYDAARTELRQVKQSPLSPEVAARVDDLLALLDRAVAGAAADKGAAIFSAYVEGEFGYDSNINTAANANSIFIPVLNLPGTLSGFATAQGSLFEGLNAGAAVQKRVAENVDVYGNVGARFRYHSNKPDFAIGSLSGGAGVRYTQGVDQYSVGVTQFDDYIDRYRNDNQTGIYGQWQRELSRQDMVGLFVQHLRLNHPIARFLDTNLTLLGGTWAHAYHMKGDPIVRVVAFAGDDHQRSDDPTVGRQLYGVKLAGEYMLQENMRLFGSVATQYSRYGGESIWFLTKRRDWRHDLDVGIAYKPAKLWTVTGEITYLHNDSNVSLNEFDRKQVFVTLRRDFF